MVRTPGGKRCGNQSPGKPSTQPPGIAVRNVLCESAMRGTKCVNCARLVLWGERLGNDLSYPAAEIPSSMGGEAANGDTAGPDALQGVVRLTGGSVA